MQREGVFSQGIAAPTTSGVRLGSLTQGITLGTTVRTTPSVPATGPSSGRSERPGPVKLEPVTVSSLEEMEEVRVRSVPKPFHQIQ